MNIFKRKPEPAPPPQHFIMYVKEELVVLPVIRCNDGTELIFCSNSCREQYLNNHEELNNDNLFFKMIPYEVYRKEPHQKCPNNRCDFVFHLYNGSSGYYKRRNNFIF